MAKEIVINGSIVKNAMNDMHLESVGNATIREIDVSCHTFAELAESHEVREIDFLSVDTEGGELEILASIDFNRYPTKIISVENNYYSRDIRALLESRGFLYLGTFGVDEIYLHGGEKLAAAMHF